MKKSPPPTPKKKQPHYKGHSTRHLFPSIQLPHKVQQRWVIFFFLFYIPFYLFFTSFFCFFNIFCIICVHPIRQLKKNRRLLSMNSWTMPKLWPNWPKPSLSSSSIACAWSVAAPKQGTTQEKRYVGNGRCKRQRRGEDLLGQQRGGKVRNWQRWTLGFFFIDGHLLFNFMVYRWMIWKEMFLFVEILMTIWRFCWFFLE